MAGEQHLSVLFDESLDGLAIKADGTYIDGTFGRGGHSGGILSRLGDNGRLFAIDRDLSAIKAAEKYAADPRFSITHSPFSHMQQVAEQHDIVGQVDGILLDLGVSSPQLDQAERGFSFLRDGPLDMRMDNSSGESAADWLAYAEEKDIAWVLKNYGEEKFSKRIARAIVERRVVEPLTTTKQLADLVDEAVPRKEDKKHPATRSFQAIRIFVNKELDEITDALNAALDVLKPGGRLVVISFHSLEDRIVKQFMRSQSKGLVVPRGLPLTEEQLNQGIRMKTIGKAIKPGTEEVKHNTRARSSVLRIAERIA